MRVNLIQKIETVKGIQSQNDVDEILGLNIPNLFSKPITNDGIF